jgi:hypothetical protein
MSERIENAQIESFYLQIDRGMLSFWIGLKYVVGQQSVGGFRLASEDGPPNPKTASAIFNLLRTVGADATLNLKGRIVRVKHRDSGVQPIIGHVLEDKWWDVEQELRSDPPAPASQQPTSK